MTVPITPGPFSFLGTAGQAVGGYLSGREDYRQQRRTEALQGVTMLLAMREKGLIPPEQFSHPEVLSMFQDAGIAAPSSQPTPDEQTRAMKGQYLSDINQPANVAFPLQSLGGVPEPKPVLGPADRYTTEQRVAIGAPTQSQLLQERGAQATATATLPEAGVTALAGQQSDQDKTYNDIADRIVESAYSGLGAKRLPTVQEVMAIAQNDPKVSAFKGAINAQYYGQAIERLRSKLAKEDIARQQAAYRFNYGLGGQPIDIKLLGQLNDMVQIADKKLADMRKDPVLNVLLMNPANDKDPRVQQVKRIEEQRDRMYSASSKYASGMVSQAEIQQLMQDASALGLTIGGAPPSTAKTAAEAKARMTELRKAGKSQEEIKQIMTQEGYKFQ